MVHHVFVPALTDLQRGELASIRDAEQYAFHDLLGYDRLVGATTFDFDALLDQARAELDAFPARVDAIIAHWDFPTSAMVPVLAAERGLPTPGLASVLACEHKYWSRLEQAASVPEVVPAFSSFDPFVDDPLADVDVPFPCWVKPVKAHSSHLGFRVEDPEQFRHAVAAMREGVGDLGVPFDRALARVEVPEAVRGSGGTTCVAEQVVRGTQVAHEGSVHRGEVDVHGVVDMRKDAAGRSIERLDYPAATVPDAVLDHMADVSRRLLADVGFDDGCFNAEFMWDAERGRLWLIEVNTRISQSHSDLFAKVDGATNHDVAIDVALGRRPSMPHREGRYAVATKYHLLSDVADGIVRRVPTPEEVADVAGRFPETLVRVLVEPGHRLSDLPHQDAYRPILAMVYVGADDRDELEARCRAIHRDLPFDVEPAADGAVAGT